MEDENYKPSTSKEKARSRHYGQANTLLIAEECMMLRELLQK